MSSMVVLDRENSLLTGSASDANGDSWDVWNNRGAGSSRLGQTSSQTGKRREYDTLIVASGGEDMSPDMMREWMLPLLRGLPAGTWTLCSVTLLPTGVVKARCLSSNGDGMAEISTRWTVEECRKMEAMLPSCEQLTILLLMECTSQAFALLDVVSDWLIIHDVDRQSLPGLYRLSHAFDILLDRPDIRKG